MGRVSIGLRKQVVLYTHQRGDIVDFGHLGTVTAMTSSYKSTEGSGLTLKERKEPTAPRGTVRTSTLLRHLTRIRPQDGVRCEPNGQCARPMRPSAIVFQRCEPAPSIVHAVAAVTVERLWIGRPALFSSAASGFSPWRFQRLAFSHSKQAAVATSEPRDGRQIRALVAILVKSQASHVGEKR